MSILDFLRQFKIWDKKSKENKIMYNFLYRFIETSLVYSLEGCCNRLQYFDESLIYVV